MDTSITLQFGDGEYLFALPLPQIFELERKCGATLSDGSSRNKSVFQMYSEISQGIGVDDKGSAVFVDDCQASALDVIEIIRLGLIGGAAGVVNGESVAVTPIKSQHLVRDYCYPNRPLSECLGTAWAVLHASISGVQVKKKPPPKRTRAKTI